MNLFLQGGLLDHSVKQDLDLGLQYEDVQYDTEEVYESEVHVEDVNLADTVNSVYFNVGLESESDHSEVLSLPSTSEETVTVTVRNNTLKKHLKMDFSRHKLMLSQLKIHNG